MGCRLHHAAQDQNTVNALKNFFLIENREFAPRGGSEKKRETAMTHSPVCISAIGAITPLGDTLDQVSAALQEGRTGIRTIKKFATDTYATKWAGLPELGNDTIRWPRERPGQVARPGEILYAEKALNRLLAEFNPSDAYQADRIGCVIGVDEPAIDIERCSDLLAKIGVENSNDREKLVANAIEHFRVSELLDLDVTSVVRAIHRQVRFSGYTRCHVGLCSASLQALGMATAAIDDGRIDAAIVGGVSAKVTPLNVARLEGIGAVCTDPQLEGPARSRPFDARRSGFIPAEGAILFVVEREDAVRRRGHTPYARLMGYGASLSAEHIVAPHTQDREMFLCMQRALAHSGLKAQDISCINAHGTSTKLNDLHESRAIRRLFGDTPMPPVTAAKSLHGHLIAAAGAMEVMGVIANFRDDFIGAIRNLDEVDPRIEVPLARSTRSIRLNNVLKNSFGMGGLASSMVLQNPSLAA
ncbi:beta-ketoacyl-[acyl-carrier-protein] synthase family protein [Nguyenibacter vanlangensis]|uniref:Beta-ketoacyl-[acyl-carrier-protein] synthase family protein n=1 Tax=Nguyenibacter vanlangensis TaxID=1216886 RepID=A0ABZ3D2I8_9PROT